MHTRCDAVFVGDGGERDDAGGGKAGERKAATWKEKPAAYARYPGLTEVT